jgi:CheY-like chemotaxis protein
LDVVVVTGSRETETVERCEGFGAYYIRKGPQFWNGLGTALTELFPHLANSIKELHHQPVGTQMRERPRVLVIDDDFAIRQFLSSRLDKCDVELLFSSNIAQGFRMACREEPSVIISDHFLPNGGIPYLLARLRTTPETENIPVFALTGRDLGEVTEQSLLRESAASLVWREFSESRSIPTSSLGRCRSCAASNIIGWTDKSAALAAGGLEVRLMQDGLTGMSAWGSEAVAKFQSVCDEMTSVVTSRRSR